MPIALREIYFFLYFSLPKLAVHLPILYTRLRGPSCKMITQEEYHLLTDSMCVFFVFSKLLASTEPMSKNIYESPRPRRLAKEKKRKTKTASKNYP